MRLREIGQDLTKLEDLENGKAFKLTNVSTGKNLYIKVSNQPEHVDVVAFNEDKVDPIVIKFYRTTKVEPQIIGFIEFTKETEE